MKYLTLAILPTLLATAAFGAEKKATVVGSKATIRYHKQEKKLLLHVDDASKAFGWEAKLVKPDELLTICRGGETGVCIPVRLKKVTWTKQKSGIFVDAKVLAKTLRFKIEEKEGKVALRRKKKKKDADAIASLPSYNEAWGEGRGFQVAQTLPDIPLYDLDGNEVRFSQFLGKQYVIYAWASW